MVYVYAIVSLMDGVIYVGISQDVGRRLAEHNAGKSRYTKGHMPWRLFYTESCDSYAVARVREKQLKTTSGKTFLKSQLALLD